MKNFNFSFLVILLAALMVGITSAAPVEKLMTVNIPFAFVVGKDSFPAGEYEVLGQIGSSTIWIKSSNGAKVITGFAIPYRERKVASDSALVFNRYGDDYFLAKVLLAGWQDSKVFNKSRRETEIERLASSGGTGGVQVQTMAKR